MVVPRLRWARARRLAPRASSSPPACGGEPADFRRTGWPSPDRVATPPGSWPSCNRRGQGRLDLRGLRRRMRRAWRGGRLPAGRGERIIAVDLSENVWRTPAARSDRHPGRQPRRGRAGLEIPGGFGADYTFEATGNVAVMRQAVESARMGCGLCTIAGVAGRGEVLEVMSRFLITGGRVAGASFRRGQGARPSTWSGRPPSTHWGACPRTPRSARWPWRSPRADREACDGPGADADAG
jgi:hypothetical protein